MDYEKLLEKAKKEMPKAALEKERFEIPKIMGHMQGNRTVLSNFIQIANVFSRKPEHMLKFILKEIAAPGKIMKSGSVIITTKVSASKINEKIRKYAHDFVLCHECGKPDTKIIKEGSINFLRCLACGAKKVIKLKI